ncbi:type VII toxin-antitoxin system HepT family RNase toxin [Jeotgalibacillus proteolyticus]|uniref:type VII toxin-antitoxin system HepT family RNase toxin n=1 Tax=Jeotgalibacillus proteolyticus TaxID=2082395 RepID=UPI003CF26F55
MRNEIILNKFSIIERCLHRIREVYDNQPANLNNITKQDSIILNLQRACEASIGIAMHIIAEKRLGLPQSRSDAFTFLEKEEVITSSLSQKMKAMVVFQKTAVHDYQKMNLVILQNVIEDRLVDFMEYTKTILTY